MCLSVGLSSASYSNYFSLAQCPTALGKTVFPSCAMDYSDETREVNDFSPAWEVPPPGTTLNDPTFKYSFPERQAEKYDGWMGKYDMSGYMVNLGKNVFQVCLYFELLLP